MKFELLEQKAKEAGFTDIELYSVKAHNLSINFFDLEIDQREETTTEVFAIRGVYNNQIAIVHTECDSDEEIDRLINELKVATTNITKDDPFFIYGGDSSYTPVNQEELEVSKLSTQDKINLMQGVIKEMMKAKDFYHSECAYAESESFVAIQNSKGLNVVRKEQNALYYASVALKRAEEIREAHEFEYIKQASDLDAQSLVEKLLAEASSKFGAESIVSNSYPVVLHNSVVGSLIGAYASAFYATSVKQKTSFLENMLGKNIFGSNINLYDDPYLKAAPSQINFDDEGVKTTKTTMVENGVLKTYLHNLSTAKYFNTTTTGNGYKPGISASVSVSSSYLVLEAGDASFDDLLSEVKNGVLVTNVTGLHAGVNQFTGEFNLQASGYLIENGQKTKPISLIILSGKFQDLFNSVTKIGNDTKLRGRVFTPSIAVKQMNISGK